MSPPLAKLGEVATGRVVIGHPIHKKATIPVHFVVSAGMLGL